MRVQRFLRTIFTCGTTLAAVFMFQPAFAIGEGLTKDAGPQPLAQALEVFAADTGLQLVYRAEITSGLTSKGAHAGLSPEATLQELLRDTGLTFEFVNARTVTIRKSGAHSVQSLSDFDESAGAARGINNSEIRDSGASPKPGFWDGFRLAQNEPSSPSESASSRDETPSQSSNKNTDNKLEEIIVTANRREQSAQDVAGGLQVFSGSDLDRQGANQFADYLLQVPGVSLRDQGAGAERVSLRGISNVAGSDNGITAPSSTVGLYLDDISISDTSNLPDISSYDLQRIEILRGPQGTLYGEGAMGGAIKMVPNEPKLNQFEARSDITLSGTEGNGFNYGLRGLANIPLVADKVGLRLSGRYQNLDGFIDNVFSGKDNINRSTEYSVRALLLANLTDKFSAEILALQNAQNQDHFGQVDPSLGDLKIYSVEPEFNDVKNSVFGLTLKYDATFATLTSISSYYTAKRDQLVRVPVLATPVFGSFGTVTQDPIAFNLDLHTFAQELRLVSQGDHLLDWVIGAYYREKKQRGLANLLIAQSDLASVNAGLDAAGLPTLPSSGTILSGDTTDTYRQYAGYGEVNYHVLDSLTLTGGVRWFHEDVLFFGDTVGNSLLAGATAVDRHEFPYSRAVPKIGISYRIDNDRMIYAQAAQGFRSGIININRSLQVGGIAAKPDTLWNYELGAKTAWAGGKIQLNGSLYYIDWKRIQTIEIQESPVSGTDIGFFGNGGNARIRGIEFELAAAPMRGIRLGTTFGYTDSEMTKVVDGSSIVGAKLPNVPKITASGFGEYRFQQDRGDTYIHFDVQHSDRQATRPITTSSDGAWVDGYTLGNLRVGFEAKQGWGVALFINNLWDERAQLGRGITGAGAIFNLERYTIARPRTYGVTFSVGY